MAVLAGGLRTRMIFDNLYALINTSLTTLGWYETGRRHSPIHMVDEAQDVEQEVKINTLALSDESVTSTPFEVGSNLTQDLRYYYVDFFAQSDAIGKHLIGDVRDILAGKMIEVGRTAAQIDVYDLRQPTPPLVFSCDILDVRIDRAHGYTHPWLRHWYSIQFTVYDSYNNSGDTGPYGGN